MLGYHGIPYFQSHIFNISKTLSNSWTFPGPHVVHAVRKSRLSVIGRALRGRHGRREVSPSVAAMTESLALVSGLLKRAAGTGGGSVSSTVYAMGEAKVGMVGGVEKWRSLTSASETPVSCFEIGCLEGHYYMCSHGQVAEALENALGLLEELWLGWLVVELCNHWRFELHRLRVHLHGCKSHRK